MEPLKTRWIPSRTAKEKIQGAPLEPPPHVTPDLGPPAEELPDVPTYTGRKRGRKRKTGYASVPRSISMPADLEARLRAFSKAQKVNVSAWISGLVAADLKRRGY